MTTAEIVKRSLDVAEMMKAIDSARREITLAEVDLIFAAHGCQDRMQNAKRRFGLAAEVLNTWGK